MKPLKSFWSLQTIFKVFEPWSSRHFICLMMSHDVTWHSKSSNFLTLELEVFKPSDLETPLGPFSYFPLFLLFSLIVLFAFLLRLTYIWHILIFNWYLMIPYMLVHILDCASRTILILSSSDPLLDMLCILVHCCPIDSVWKSGLVRFFDPKGHGPGP